MNRFIAITLLAVIAFFAIGASMRGWPRIWAFTGFWFVYLSIVGCGIGLIQMRFFYPAICRLEPGNMRVALTFDDGPNPAVTPALLDLLRRENIKAVFFCIGKNVEANKALTAQIGAEGHLIGNHTYHHAWCTAFMTARGLGDEIALTQQAIVNATGIAPVYFRPPIGLTNPHYSGVLGRIGLTMIGWNVRSMDTVWRSQKVIDRVLARTRDGSIILLHDSGSSPQRVIEIVTAIISGLRSRGFEFERLDRAISPNL